MRRFGKKWILGWGGLHSCSGSEESGHQLPWGLYVPLQVTNIHETCRHPQCSEPPRKDAYRQAWSQGWAEGRVPPPLPLSLLLVCLLSRQNPPKISASPEFLGRVIKHKYFPFQDSLNSQQYFYGCQSLIHRNKPAKLSFPPPSAFPGLGMSEMGCLK